MIVRVHGDQEKTTGRSNRCFGHGKSKGIWSVLPTTPLWHFIQWFLSYESHTLTASQVGQA